MTAVDGAPVTTLDPRRPLIITILGRKRSGKSELASVFWRSYPFDRIVIDSAGDAKVGGAGLEPGHRDHVRTVTAGELRDLGRFPQLFDDDGNRVRVSLRFVPDVGADTYEQDIDQAVGLAFGHPDARCLLWCDEQEEITRANKTLPHTRRALAMSRHNGLTILNCGPRAVGINPKVIAQADYLYLFDLPHPHDRRRVAEVIGADPDELDDVIFELGEHEYARWDAGTREMIIFPPIPLRA